MKQRINFSGKTRNLQQHHHRTCLEKKGKTTRNNTAGKKQSRTIVIKLANYKDKSMILRNVHKLKRSDIFINEDFSKQTTGLRIELCKEVNNYVQKVKLPT